MCTGQGKIRPHWDRATAARHSGGVAGVIYKLTLYDSDGDDNGLFFFCIRSQAKQNAMFIFLQQENGLLVPMDSHYHK